MLGSVVGKEPNESPPDAAVLLLPTRKTTIKAKPSQKARLSRIVVLRVGSNSDDASGGIRLTLNPLLIF